MAADKTKMTKEVSEMLQAVIKQATIAGDHTQTLVIMSQKKHPK